MWIEQPDSASILFSRTRITRREALSFLMGGAVTTAMAIFFLAPKTPTASEGQQQATTTTQQPAAKTTTQQVAAHTTTQQGSGPPSYMISRILATTTIDTQLIS